MMESEGEGWSMLEEKAHALPQMPPGLMCACFRWAFRGPLEAFFDKDNTAESFSLAISTFVVCIWHMSRRYWQRRAARQSGLLSGNLRFRYASFHKIWPPPCMSHCPDQGEMNLAMNSGADLAWWWRRSGSPTSVSWSPPWSAAWFDSWRWGGWGRAEARLSFKTRGSRSGTTLPVLDPLHFKRFFVVQQLLILFF